MAKITHYQAQINLPGHYSPERGPITDEAILCLANYGTTPGHVSPDLRARADKMLSDLREGWMVTAGAAEIYPLTTEDFEAGRCTNTDHIRPARID